MTYHKTLFVNNHLPSQNGEEIRYHYTNFEALKNILLEKRIRLTHFKYLNDTSEGELLYEYVLAIIKDQKDISDRFEKEYKAALKNLYIANTLIIL